MKKPISLIIVILMLFSIVSCDGRIDPDDLVDVPNGGNGGLIVDGNEEDKPSDDITGGWGQPEDSENPEPTPVPDDGAVYLLNRLEWEPVAVYYWNMDSHSEINGGWPGIKLTLGDDGLYKATTDYKYTHLIFNNNNGGAQTPDLNCPTNDRIVYDNLNNRWITYSEAMSLLNSSVNPTPHEHIYVGGKCECGAADPNYSPEPDPHEHTFIDGRCECGETDPSYDPDPTPKPHEHIFISGMCECGEVDPNYTPDPNVSEELALFNALFDERSKVTIKLKISSSELKKIQQDYEKYSSFGSKSPIYRMADLVVTITTADGVTGSWTIPEVGVRMKGNTSRTSFYSDNGGMYNLIHFKISFQETFEETEYYGSSAKVWTDKDARKARKNRTFATLEKMDMRWNRNDDTTYIRENYAYALYREYGVLAPHTNLASVDIGNDHAGVWVIYEPVDKIFLEKNLPEAAIGGDLYKLGWTSQGATFTSFSSYGVEDEDAGKFYVYDLKTNKKTSTHESLKNLISVINNRSVTKEQLSSVIDMESFIYYCAVSYMIGNPDDLRNNYNNTYIYFRADTGEMVIIPYDMDRGLGVNTWNPSGHGMTEDDPFSKRAIGNNGDQKNPLFLKTVCSGGMFIDEYIEALKEVSGGSMLTPERFEASFNIAKNLYSIDATPSKTYGNASGHKFRFDITRTCNKGESKNMSFKDYITAKQNTLARYLSTGGNSGSGSGGSNTPIENAKLYVMGGMNNWSVNSAYAMKDNGDGTYSFTVTNNASANKNGKDYIKIKIFDDNSQAWYGYEVIDPNCTVPLYFVGDNNNNAHQNIYLDLGTYLLTFDPVMVTLYIEKIN